MILRKPYAFLIKNFKLTHLILCALSIFIIIKTSAINSFFRNYVLNNYTAIITPDFKSNFITPLLYLTIIILIIVILAIIYLLKYKNKKTKIYNIYLVYYLILIIFLILAGTIFNSLEKGVLSPDAARLYRDISLIVYLPQFFFVLVCGIRALGFNVKQFNFVQDLKELEITSVDNEEIELNIEFETYKTERKIRRFIREFKYYVKENLFIFLILSTLSIILLIYFIINSPSTLKGKVYHENNQIYFKNLSINVLESMITNIDLSGNKIKEGKSYLLLKVNIKNNSGDDVILDTNDYNIFNISSNITLKPIISYSNFFLDYGANLNKLLIKNKSENIYVIPYELSNQNLKNKFELRLYKGLIVKDKVTYPTYNKIKIKPIILGDVAEVSTNKLNEAVTFSNSYVGNSNLSLTNHSVTKNYIYTYESCFKDICETYNDVISLGLTGMEYNKTLLILSGILDIDKDTIYYRNNQSIGNFINNFMRVEYYIKGIRYLSAVESMGHENLKNTFILKVPLQVEDAEEINLLVTIRNKMYRFQIKN